MDYKIGDSAEGWAKCRQADCTSLPKNETLIIDTSDIRGAGMRVSVLLISTE